MVSGEKRMTPSRFQDPLRPFATSHTGSGGAPETSTFWSLPSAKNARNRLSGDQNGKVAPCVPGIGFAASSPVGRSHRRVLPSASFAANVMKRPSGRHRERAAAGLGQVELGLLGRQHECPDAHGGTRRPAQVTERREARARRSPRPRRPRRASRGSCAARRRAPAAPPGTRPRRPTGAGASRRAPSGSGPPGPWRGTS